MDRRPSGNDVEVECVHADETLPTFENPPVVETVMSVQFDPLSKLTDAHLGGFWFERRGGRVGV